MPPQPSVLNIAFDRLALADACQRHGVRQLDLFGSAVTKAFKPGLSDIDLLADIELSQGQSYLDAFQGLHAELEAIFGQRVDLIANSTMQNPFFRAAVDRQRQRLFP